MIHSTVPAPSTATDLSNTPLPIAAATWSWLTDTISASSDTPSSVARARRIFPALVPVGTWGGDSDKVQ